MASLPPSPCTERMWISAKWMERSISPQRRHLYVRTFDFLPGVGSDSRFDDLKRSVLWFWVKAIQWCGVISNLCNFVNLSHGVFEVFRHVNSLHLYIVL